MQGDEKIITDTGGTSGEQKVATHIWVLPSLRFYRRLDRPSHNCEKFHAILKGGAHHRMYVSYAGRGKISGDLPIASQKIRGRTQKNKGASSMILPQGLNFLPVLREYPYKAKGDALVVCMHGQNNG